MRKQTHSTSPALRAYVGYGPAHSGSVFSPRSSWPEMAALLESLLSKKTDVNGVLDWLKNFEVGLNDKLWHA